MSIDRLTVETKPHSKDATSERNAYLSVSAGAKVGHAIDTRIGKIKRRDPCFSDEHTPANRMRDNSVVGKSSVGNGDIRTRT